jgi:hypothetical protein
MSKELILKIVSYLIFVGAGVGIYFYAGEVAALYYLIGATASGLLR